MAEDPRGASGSENLPSAETALAPTDCAALTSGSREGRAIQRGLIGLPFGTMTGPGSVMASAPIEVGGSLNQPCPWVDGGRSRVRQPEKSWSPRACE